MYFDVQTDRRDDYIEPLLSEFFKIFVKNISHSNGLKRTKTNIYVLSLHSFHLILFAGKVHAPQCLQRSISVDSGALECN